MTTLLRNRASFEGQTIRVIGQYRSLPLLVCGTTTHRSPASWTLVFGDIETFVAGFDDALRPLAASGLSLTIEGRWQKWEGPIGCGRRAPSQEIWYLAASRIVSPNPLVKSDSDEDVIVVLPSPTSDTGPDPTEIAQITPDEQPTETIETPEANLTPSPSPTFQTIPSPPPAATITPRPSSTPEIDSSPTSTITSTTSTTPPATSDGTTTVTSTATATATTSGGPPAATNTPADQGALSLDTVEKSVLAANTPHIWRFTPTAGEPITLTAGSGLNMNIKLELIGPGGTIVATANQGTTGQPETILHTPPSPSGQYQVIISDAGGATGPYILMMFDDNSEPEFVIQRTITYGTTGSGSVPANIDHIWNFEGLAGDVISVLVSPTSGSGDLVLYLVTPSGELLEIIDDTSVGGNESINGFNLTESGFYSIGIGELDFAPVSYSMTLTTP